MVGEVTISIASDSFPIGKSMDDFKIPHIFNTEHSREDLQEYLGDFLSDIGGVISIRLYPFKEKAGIYLYLHNGQYTIKMDQGFSLELPFSVIDKWDVPRFGNYIFDMWNAYVMAFVDDDIKLIVHERDFDGKPRFMLEEEDDEEDVNVLFRSMPWIVPEEDE